MSHEWCIYTSENITICGIYVSTPVLRFLHRFILLAGNLPRSSRVSRRDTEMGVSCMSHVWEDRETFVVGAETGGLFKCSVHARGDPAGSELNCINLIF